MFCASSSAVAVFGILVPFMPSVESYIIARCLEGVGCGGTIVTGFVLCIEYCGLAHREIVSALFHIPINIASIAIAGISYLLRNFEHYQLCLSVPVLLCATLYWSLMESPKWLLDKGHLGRATKVMERICKL